MTVEFNFEIPGETEKIFTDDALKFLEHLHNKFDGKIKEVLKNRAVKQGKFNQGHLPNFLTETSPKFIWLRLSLKEDTLILDSDALSSISVPPLKSIPKFKPLNVNNNNETTTSETERMLNLL